MKSDFYIKLFLTESEHGIIEKKIRDKCKELGWEVSYYRKLKTGHIPCYRECKILRKPWEVKKMLIELGVIYEY